MKKPLAYNGLSEYKGDYGSQSCDEMNEEFFL